MRGMNSETVDLIYLDPPFNSNANYAAPVGSQAAGAAFKDTWTLSDVDAEWINLIERRHPAVHRVLLAAMTNSDKSYLSYMAARLLEMPRLLKPTGSIYLHCDPTMSHYLKLLMDAVFGRVQFQNHITWKRTTAHNDSRRFGRVEDHILFYTMGYTWTWNQPFQPYDERYIARFSRTDPDGRKWSDYDLTAKGLSGGGYEYEYKGSRSLWRVPIETMRELDANGYLHFTSKGGIRRKRYLDELQGRPAQSVWEDISPINSQAKERMGYPTQKPLALLNRIIEASSSPGDMVLDPFCGCATTMVSADRLDRQWVGIDLSEKAAELVVRRVEADQGLWRSIVHRTDNPQRTDLGPLPAYNSAANKQQLYGQQGGDCAGCGTHFQMQHLTVDHIIAQSKGGTDHIDNLQLLCGHCNSIKGDRGMEYLKSKLQLATP